MNRLLRFISFLSHHFSLICLNIMAVLWRNIIIVIDWTLFYCLNTMSIMEKTQEWTSSRLTLIYRCSDLEQITLPLWILVSSSRQELELSDLEWSLFLLLIYLNPFELHFWFQLVQLLKYSSRKGILFFVCSYLGK